MGLGHELDADTIGLWHLKEVEQETRYLLDAAPGGRHLAFNLAFENPIVPDVYLPRVVPARDEIGTCRLFSGNELGVSICDPTMRTTLLGSFSLEAWIQPTTVAGDNDLFAVGYAAEDADSNFLIEFGFDGSGHLYAFHEHTAGTNVTAAQAAGAVIVAGTWHHVAVTKTVAGADAVYRLYVDGVLVHTSGTLTNCDGGAGDRQPITIAGWTGGNKYDGRLKDMRLSNVVRSDADITADAAIVNQHHALDASTVALWRMEEIADAVDESTLGVALDIVNLDNTNATDAGFELGGFGTCGARYFNAMLSLDALPGHPAEATYVAAFEGDWTFEAWLKLDGDLPDSSQTGGRALCAFGDEALSNRLMVSLGRDRRLTIIQEHGAGVDDTWTSTDPVIPAATALAVHHVAVTGRITGAGIQRIEIYVDGVFVEESTDLDAYDGGANGYFRLGSPAEYTTVGFLKALVYDVRLSDKRRSAAEIEDSFDRGYGCVCACSEGGGDPPEVTNPTPALGTRRGAFDPIGFDVTDDGTLRRVLVAVEGGDGGALEVVHDGNGFVAPFDGGSTRDVIAGGYRYSITRRGGWRGRSINVRVYPVDTVGNEP
jgi:hypothetical protein